MFYIYEVNTNKTIRFCKSAKECEDLIQKLKIQFPNKVFDYRKVEE